MRPPTPPPTGCQLRVLTGEITTRSAMRRLRSPPIAAPPQRERRGRGPVRLLDAEGSRGKSQQSPGDSQAKGTPIHLGIERVDQPGAGPENGVGTRRLETERVDMTQQRGEVVGPSTEAGSVYVHNAAYPPAVEYDLGRRARRPRAVDDNRVARVAGPTAG